MGVTRELAITYSGYTVGGADTNPQLTRWQTQRLNFVEAAVEFEFVIVAATAAALTTACNAAEVAFRTPYAALTVVNNSSTILSLSAAANTGFNSMPEIYKREGEASGLHRTYGVRIVFGMPADTSSTSGRRDSKTNVEWMPSRRMRMTIQGTYTALSSNTSKAQYEAAIAAFATTQLALYSLSPKDLVAETTDIDDQNKVCNFTRTYQQLIYSDAGSSDDSALIDGQLTVTRRKEAPGDSGLNVIRPIILDAAYSAWMDYTVSQALTTKCAAVRAWIVNSQAALFQAGSLAVTDEAAEFDPVNNKFRLNMTLWILSAAGLLSAKVTSTPRSQSGAEFVGVWDGSEDSYYVFDGKATRTLTITKEYTRPAGSGIVPNDPVLTGSTGEGGNDPFSFLGWKFKVLEQSQPKTVLRKGIAPNQLQVEDISWSETRRYYKDPGGAPSVVFSPLRNVGNG